MNDLELLLICNAYANTLPSVYFFFYQKYEKPYAMITFEKSQRRIGDNLSVQQKNVYLSDNFRTCFRKIKNI